MRWNIVGAIVAILAGVGGAVAPTATILLLAAVAATLLFWGRPKLAAGISVVAVLLGSGLSVATGRDQLGYLDEAVVLMSLAAFTSTRILQRQRIRALPGQTWILLYLILGAIGGIIREVPFLLAAQSSFLILKGFIFAFALAQIDWSANDIRKMVKPGAWVIVFALAMSLINLAIPEQWLDLFGRSPRVDYRLGLPSLMGPFDHPLVFGQFMALTAVAIIAYRANVKKSFISGALLIGTIFGSILSWRRKAIVAMIIAGVAALSITPGKKVSTTVRVIFIAPLVILLGWDSLMTVTDWTYEQYFANVEETARTLLYRDSFIIAAAAFPFGVGFGRFGSFLASQEYSPEYIALGYPHVYRMGAGAEGGFLSDTFWPAILGEAGYLGLAAFTIGLVVLARQGKKLADTSNDPHLRWIGIVSVAWFVEFAVESVAAPVFNSAPLFVLCFGAAGVVVSLVAQQQAHPEPALSQPRHSLVRRKKPAGYLP